MKALERSIEGPVVNYAKKHLGKDSVVKLNGIGKRSHPDRMFLGPYGRALFIEFKRPGAQPTPLQLALHRQWLKLGHKVHVVDDVKVGKALIDKHLLAGIPKYPLEDRIDEHPVQATRLPKARDQVRGRTRVRRTAT